ncbi:MAG TPA: alpha/beta hydrolase [Pyrinomonadaceae bacterium]|nr:alpha/beta hydrolase [Pyrinomonadaceae bacterium]
MKRSIAFAKTCTVALLLTLSLATTFAAMQDQTAPAKPEGDWRGTLDAGVAKLNLILHVVRKDGTLSATLDSPEQGATGLAVDSITLNGKSLRFEMQSLGATYEGVFSNDGSQIQGEFRQQGQKFPLTFKRISQTDSQGSLTLQKVDVGGHSLNLLMGGQGSPAVVFEGGFGTGIASWSTVQKEVAAFARTVSYDRAGLGQSELGPKPRSAKQIATELHTALEKAGIKPPYVLVGHSFGGIYVRVFADMYPKEVVGMVLIDPSQESFNDWLKKSQLARLKDAQAQIAKAPEGVQAEAAATEVSYGEARVAKVPPGIPVTLLSATEDETMPADARRLWIEKHEEWIATVPGGKHIVVEKTQHFIQAQQPKLVIETIQQMLNSKR